MQQSTEIIISVIMPVYNVEKYLIRAINSILGQRFPYFEIILVDDGSKDGSGELCDELAKLDERIVVIHKQNGGVSSARNAGIDIARGKYIYFMDPDDYVIGELLKDNIAIAEKYHCSQVVFGFVNVICHSKEEKEIKRVFYKHNMHGLYSYDEFKLIYQDHLKNVNQVVWNRIYSREVIGNTRFSDTLNTAEDAVFNMELTQKGFESIYYNNECYYVYVCRQNSLMNKYNPKRFENEMIITDTIKELVLGWGMAERFEKYLSCKYVETALSEYGNMTMHDCTLSYKEKAEKIKSCCRDVRISNAVKSISSKDLQGPSLKVLYLLTKNGMYKGALIFKRVITPLSIFIHKSIALLRGIQEV